MRSPTKRESSRVQTTARSTSTTSRPVILSDKAGAVSRALVRASAPGRPRSTTVRSLSPNAVSPISTASTFIAAGGTPGRLSSPTWTSSTMRTSAGSSWCSASRECRCVPRMTVRGCAEPEREARQCPCCGRRARRRGRGRRRRSRIRAGSRRPARSGRRTGGAPRPAGASASGSRRTTARRRFGSRPAAGTRRRRRRPASASGPRPCSSGTSRRRAPKAGKPAGCRSAVCTTDSVKNSTHQPPASSRKPSSGGRRRPVASFDDPRKRRNGTSQKRRRQQPQQQHRPVEPDAAFVGERRQEAQDVVLPEEGVGEIAARASRGPRTTAATARPRRRGRPRPPRASAAAVAGQPAVQHQRRRPAAPGRPAPWPSTPRPQATAASSHQPQRSRPPRTASNAANRASVVQNVSTPSRSSSRPMPTKPGARPSSRAPRETPPVRRRCGGRRSTPGGS